MRNKIYFLLMMAGLLCIAPVYAQAQSMAGTVKTVNVKFAPGKNQTIVRGTASYAMSYVYVFKAKAGQKLTVKAASGEPELTFSVMPPDENAEPLAFMVTDYAGETPETGTYSITLVMNNENASKVPYSLTIKIQ